MDREELITDPRFTDNATRRVNVEALDEEIGNWMGQNSTERVLALFEEFEVAGAPVNNIAQIAHHPHFQARNLLQMVDDPDLGPTSTVHVHPRMSATPGGVRNLGGAIGRDNDDFYLNEMGLSVEEFQALRDAGAV
jgi:crotonobetainyl-CoA:carnitine CoA-transferase CaiB-like acyl-CoA transferase